jgi:hypothetical protein
MAEQIDFLDFTLDICLGKNAPQKKSENLQKAVHSYKLYFTASP